MHHGPLICSACLRLLGVIEYISTLEGDIAERDHLLQVVRAQLGETQSENVALRQEIDALKKVLLSGRGSAGESAFIVSRG